MPLTIDAHEIIIMVNYAWELSFARCAKNKEAIATYTTRRSEERRVV